MMDMVVISSYSRAEAFADGVLVNVSTTAREAGFVWPVAVTHALWTDIRDVPPHLHGIADVSGRLWDVLWMAFCAIKRTAGDGGSELHYDLFMQVGTAPAELYTVKLVCGPGDQTEPVITLMRPDES